MAKPRRNVVIQKVPGSSMIIIWAQNHKRFASDISSIEGISSVYIEEDCLHVFTSPIYDNDEIVAEIEQLANAEVPDVFKEDQ